MIGASDAGAHLDLLASFNYATVLLGQAVRERELLAARGGASTSSPTCRRSSTVCAAAGRVEEGAHADVVVLDPDTVGERRRSRMRFDLPGGAGRLYAERRGHRARAGQRRAIVRDDELTDERSGTLLRSGRDTEHRCHRLTGARRGAGILRRSEPWAERPGAERRERKLSQYTHGHHESVLRSHRSRTVENSAAYLIDRLRPGVDVLDVGCGPGTITVDLAARVAPGRVVGLDNEADIVDAARGDASRSVAERDVPDR